MLNTANSMQSLGHFADLLSQSLADGRDHKDHEIQSKNHRPRCHSGYKRKGASFKGDETRQDRREEDNTIHNQKDWRPKRSMVCYPAECPRFVAFG